MRHIETILETIAHQHGVTVQEVHAEIQSAIDEAYANPDPAIWAAWRRYGFDHHPDAETLLLKITDEIQQRRTPGTKPGVQKSEISG